MSRLDRIVMLPPLLILLVVIGAPTCCDPGDRYMKLSSPPDVYQGNQPFCGRATAANMLAAAGYGPSGQNVGARALAIYNELKEDQQLGPSRRFTATVLQWWLLKHGPGSCSSGPCYVLVTLSGDLSLSCSPGWDDPKAPLRIGSALRECQFVGLSYCRYPGFPNEAPHVISVWGDDGPDAGNLTSNPQRIYVTDSVTNTTPAVEEYELELQEGHPWSFASVRWPSAVRYVVFLGKADWVPGPDVVVRMATSLRVVHTGIQPASGISYTLSYGSEIRDPESSVDLGGTTCSCPTPASTGGMSVDFDCDFPPPDQVQPGKSATISTVFTAKEWLYSTTPTPSSSDVTANLGVTYRDVEFKLAGGAAPTPKRVPHSPGLDKPIREQRHQALPAITWAVATRRLEDAITKPNVIGGYLVGSFSVSQSSSAARSDVLATYRFVHQYSFAGSPEHHVLVLDGPSGLWISNLKLGHSYSYLDGESLWQFNSWMPLQVSQPLDLKGAPIKIGVDWDGLLPYPQAYYGPAKPPVTPDHIVAPGQIVTSGSPPGELVQVTPTPGTQ